MHFASDRSEWPSPPHLLGELCRAIEGPIGNDHRLDAAGNETLAVRSLVSPAPRIMTRRPARSPEDLSRKLHRARRRRMLAPRGDLSCRCDVFGDAEGVLEQFVEVAAGRAELGRGRIGLLDLAENLRFPRTIESRPLAHAKQVPHAPGSIVKIKAAPQRLCDFRRSSLQRIKARTGHRLAAQNSTRLQVERIDGSGKAVDAANRAQRLLASRGVPTANFSRISRCVSDDSDRRKGCSWP